MLSLPGCHLDGSKPETIYVETQAPEYPIAGENVAREIDSVCIPRDKCAALFSWLARLSKFVDQLNAPDEVK